MAHLKRNISEKLNELLSYFPVVIVSGVRQCGKTTLVKEMRPEWRYMDLENARDFDRLSTDPGFFFKQHPDSVIFDEAQCFPQLFREIRSVVDKEPQRTNRFLLTGSSSLDLVRNVSESLAGRVGFIELGTFKANEVFSHERPAFYDIFEGKISQKTVNTLLQLQPKMDHESLMEIFFKGGYPEPVLKRDDRFFQIWMENYYHSYVQRDIRSLFPRLNLINYQRFISMLSALSGTIINRSQVGRSLDTSEVSIRDYLEIAEGSFIWRNVPSYEKSGSKSIVKMPKGFFRDSGLAHTLQRITTFEELNNHPTVGFSFESFISEELIKGVQATKATHFNYHYYRTRNGAEIDLLLEGSFGLLPVEIKYGTSINRNRLRTLTSFINENDLPLGILINNSDQTELITDNIIQIPATLI